ncbi:MULTISPECIES: TIGR03943 family protein [Spirulina sp. CCY15215]|uniref:TIGR03943 family putative permease subunit n=1 Tax=Spirulina sp. CCY15215 TaxID=2767591 RepID=UPI0019522309|nr:TIGR03943 family protein [Spirulina major]
MKKLEQLKQFILRLKQKNPRPQGKSKKAFSFKDFYTKILPWFDVFALLNWGLLMVKYRFTGQLQLLIHPNYFTLVLITGIVLIALSGIRTWQLLKQLRRGGSREPEVRHITIFPPGVATALLAIAAIAGLIVPPKVLASDTALQRGITESLPFTRTQVQSFTSRIKPEDRSLMDWIRTLNAYPEPDAYTDLPANVTGFVVHIDSLPEDYLMISRFVITCCAVDAYPVGLPVKLPSTRDQFPPDTWLKIEGVMTTEELNGERRLVINAIDANKIDTPSNPYEF